MNNEATLNDRSTVTAEDLLERVKKSRRISSLVFIVADDKPQDKRRAEVLTAVYRFILSPKWGKS